MEPRSPSLETFTFGAARAARSRRTRRSGRRCSVDSTDRGVRAHGLENAVRGRDDGDLVGDDVRAIAAVETGTTDVGKPCKKVGKAGERSAWQIKPSTWRAYTKEDFKKLTIHKVQFISVS